MTKRKKKKKGKQQNNCFICGDPCVEDNAGKWGELWYMGRRERRVKACLKHDGVKEEIKRQEE